MQESDIGPQKAPFEFTDAQVKVAKAELENINVRYVWVFEVMDGPGSREEPWEFVEYMATGYDTDDRNEARELAEREYGVHIRGSERRKLTFPEYSCVLRCNIRSPHGQRVYQAMLRILFTGTFYFDGGKQ